MVSIDSLLLAASAVAAVFAAPTDLAIRSPGELAERQSITTSQTGTNNGYYYSFCRFYPLSLSIISIIPYAKENSPLSIKPMIRAALRIFCLKSY
jgi:hypothetical protein